MPVPLAAVLHADAGAAEAALRDLGAEHDPRLDLVHEVAGFGRIARRFGTLCNPIGAGPVADRRLLDWFDALLAGRENAALRGRADALSFCPVNKTMARQLAEDLLSGGVHLPWAYRPMNLDLASRIGKLHREHPVPYQAFYSQNVQLGAGQSPTVTMGRLFSIPVSGSALDTMMEPDDDRELDDRIGLLLEADAWVIG